MTPQRTDLNFEEFRKLLLKERKSLTQLHNEQRQDMQAEADDSINNELSSYDTNDPEDNAVQIYDRELNEALDGNTREMIVKIDAALDRIANGTYGICIITGQPIPVARLRALPWAQTVIEVADRVDN